MYRLVTILLIFLALTACEPMDKTPGMWLSGEVINTEIKDWSFSNEYQEVFLETHPWYGIPFSVTVVTATTGNKLFVPSIYSAPAEFPGTKYWNGIIQSNPAVFIKIGDKRYPRSAHLITDPDEFQEAFAALAKKYNYWRSIFEGRAERPPFVLIRLDAPQS